LQNLARLDRHSRELLWAFVDWWNRLSAIGYQLSAWL